MERPGHAGAGWGSVCSDPNKRDTSTQGLWTETEKLMHINYLELKAIHLGLQSLMHSITDTHILHLIRSDNTTAVSCINNKGSSKSVLDNLSKEIWQWAIDRNIWLSCANIAGTDNVKADELSRKFHVDMEWKLDSGQLKEALALLSVSPDIDMFASQIKYQFSRYVSFKPDPNAYAIDAFSLHWLSHSLYCFPPFSLLPKVLRKIATDKADGVVVAPHWKNHIAHEAASKRAHIADEPKLASLSTQQHKN